MNDLALDVDWGPISVHLAGRAVFFLWVTVALLEAAGLAVAATRRRELITRWTTWVVIAPVVGLPIWAGPGPTAALAAALAVVAVVEWSRLARLDRVDRALLLILAVGYPTAAWLAPQRLDLVPVCALLCALPSLLTGDAEDGIRRAAYTAFGSIWICWSLAQLVVVGRDGFLILFAVALTDVAAWCGGRGLRRWAWARRPLSPLSPGKTVGGLAGAVVGAVLALALLGGLRPGLVVAVALGGVLGDLLESMAKRRAGVKDAGTWLPGFGGLLDRVDSLLLVLPLAVVLT